MPDAAAPPEAGTSGHVPAQAHGAIRPVIGIDIGSTAIKAVVLQAGTGGMVWSGYRRHETRQAHVCADFLHGIEAAFPEIPRQSFRVFATGSGGTALAPAIGAAFVQEVHALCRAAEALHPRARTLIELGGEDAKIVVFHRDSRSGTRRKTASMNDKCAGGTGAIIDRIAAKTGLSMKAIAAVSGTDACIHPVAGKCGVFAESDIISLQKQGVPPEELMASLFESIVLQNLSVLARGEALPPGVLLLGGPHAFLPGLVARWRRHLPERWREHGVAVSAGDAIEQLVLVPEHALLFGAIGAALTGLDMLGTNALAGQYRGAESLRPMAEGRHPGSQGRGLVRDDAEREAFERAYMPAPWCAPDIASGTMVEAYLGIDAGSTSTKAVLLDTEGGVLAKGYRLSEGNPIEDVRRVVGDLRVAITGHGAGLRVLGVGVTGYAKDILYHVLRADAAIVETVAHMHAGLREHPDADVICDVGGQDIKVILLQHGAVRDFRLNTQCSAGNGFYLQATASALGIPVERYAETAFAARSMPTFPYGCAVFLQSDIVDVQRLGWAPEEILAGLAAVLPRNIWLYVCQMHNLPQLGKTFILQGGVQRNLAAVKAQVDYIRGRFAEGGGEPTIRVHRHCGEAGAIGCALETCHRMRAANRSSTFIGFDALETVQYQVTRDETTRCHGCTNACLRTFIDVRLDGATHRAILASCDRGVPGGAAKAGDAGATVPNLVAWSARETFRAPEVAEAGPPTRHIGKWKRGRRAAIRIGMPRVVNLYATAPFFLGYFRALGIPETGLVWSAASSDTLFREGTKRGCIDPCYPSKLAIAHLHDLIYRVHAATPLTDLFFPIIDSFPTWLEGCIGSRACPASTGTVEAATAAFRKDTDVFAIHGIRINKPFVDIGEPALAARQLWEAWHAVLGCSLSESRRAVEAGHAAWRRHQDALRAQGRGILDAIVREGGIAVVMLGRPYHVDPGVAHGVWDALQRRGYPILTIDALPIDTETIRGVFGNDPDALSIRDVWRPSFSEHSNRKIWAAKFVARHPNLVAVEWSSFRCGMDAPIAATIEAILERAGKPFFTFRNMDENRSSGAIALRVETLGYCLEQYRKRL